MKPRRRINLLLGGSEMSQTLGSAAVHVVDMFDQANTNKMVEKLGKRGELLRDAVEILRGIVNEGVQRTVLTGAEIRGR